MGEPDFLSNCTARLEMSVSRCLRPPKPHWKPASGSASRCSAEAGWLTLHCPGEREEEAGGSLLRGRASADGSCCFHAGNQTISQHQLESRTRGREAGITGTGWVSSEVQDFAKIGKYKSLNRKDPVARGEVGGAEVERRKHDLAKPQMDPTFPVSYVRSWPFESVLPNKFQERVRTYSVGTPVHGSSPLKCLRDFEA